MACRHVRRGILDMAGLVVEEEVGLELAQEGTLGQTAQEHGLVDVDVPIHQRSEERRVGKECRSRCDWSSDVCSSDLIDRPSPSTQAPGLRTPDATWPAGTCGAAFSTWPVWSSKKKSGSNSRRKAPLGRPPRNMASSTSMCQSIRDRKSVV